MSAALSLLTCGCVARRTRSACVAASPTSEIAPNCSPPSLSQIREGEKAGAHCFRSHRPASPSQTHSLNNLFRSGNSGSSLTRKPRRSQSSSPGHLPVHTCRRGSSGWKCAQPSAAQPQCGQRSTSQPSRWRSPTGAPQSGQSPSFLLMNTYRAHG